MMFNIRQLIAVYICIMIFFMIFDDNIIQEGSPYPGRGILRVSVQNQRNCLVPAAPRRRTLFEPTKCCYNSYMRLRSCRAPAVLNAQCRRKTPWQENTMFTCTKRTLAAVGLFLFGSLVYGCARFSIPAPEVPVTPIAEPVIESSVINVPLTVSLKSILNELGQLLSKDRERASPGRESVIAGKIQDFLRRQASKNDNGFTVCGIYSSFQFFRQLLTEEIERQLALKRNMKACFRLR